MPECRDCGKSEHLYWGKTKAGKPILMEIVTRPHFTLCKQNDRGKPQPKAMTEDEMKAYLDERFQEMQQAGKVT